MTHSSTRRQFLGAAGAAAALALNLRGVAAASPADYPIGCYTRAWDKYDYRVALDAIAAAGYKHVGLMTTNTKSRLVISAETPVDEATKIGGEAKARGLTIVSVYGGGIPVQKSLEEGIAGMRRLVDACAAAGAASVLMGGMGNEKFYGVYLKAIAECAGYAEEKGVGIAIKPHGGLNATGAQLRQAVERVGHKNFRVWYDAGNIAYYSDGKLNPVDDAPAVDGLVTGWCIKDYREPKEVMFTPGQGAVDFKAVFARLRRGGFVRGPLVVETLTRLSKPKTKESPAVDVPAEIELPALLAEAKKARLFLEQLVASQG